MSRKTELRALEGLVQRSGTGFLSNLLSEIDKVTAKESKKKSQKSRKILEIAVDAFQVWLMTMNPTADPHATDLHLPLQGSLLAATASGMMAPVTFPPRCRGGHGDSRSLGLELGPAPSHLKLHWLWLG